MRHSTFTDPADNLAAYSMLSAEEKCFRIQSSVADSTVTAGTVESLAAVRNSAFFAKILITYYSHACTSASCSLIWIIYNKVHRPPMAAAILDHVTIHALPSMVISESPAFS